MINSAQLIPYHLSRLVPRSRDIWVFGSWFGHRYSDNSRYVFDYVCANEPSIRAVWLTRERKIIEELRREGKEAYLIGSLAGYWLCCRSSLVFVTCGMLDVNKPGAFRAKKVQLWHGTPLKKIGLDDRIWANPHHSWVYRFFRSIWRAVFPFTVDKWDLVISPSPVVSQRLATAFGVDLSKVGVTGYPRADVILSADPELVPVVESVRNRWNARYVVCYLPTHRGEGHDSLKLISEQDVNELDDCLSRHGAVMFIKMHFYHRQCERLTGADSSGSRIHWLSEEEAPWVNKLLPHVDVLITDYSSVYFDYLLLDRPILFTPFDKEVYVLRDRQLYEDYDSATPGPKCENWRQVIAELDRVLVGEDEFAGLRRAYRDRYNSYVDIGNCQRVVELAKKFVA